jgi:hypothetical protein
MRYRLARLMLAATPWLLLGVLIAYYVAAVR